MIHRYLKRAARLLKRSDYRPLNVIELDRSRLIHNIEVIQRQHNDMAIIPVLKGNAYGHGIEQVATMLQPESTPIVAVDGYFEAMQVRDVSSLHMLVMGYVLPENVRLLDTKRCSFVVQDVASIQAFGRLKRHVRIHLEMNTGMNRLGIEPEQLPTFLDEIRSFPDLELEGVMTHLADADNAADESFTSEQVERFDASVEAIHAAGFEPSIIHIAQTAGSTKAKSKYANAIRLGIGTYGINPLRSDDPHYERLSGLKPVLSFKSTIIQVHQLEKGSKVSYGGTFVAKHPMRIGVLPVGYYEGLPRKLSGVGYVTHGKQALPILGRVCMNHVMIDLTESKLNVGDEVVVISNNPSDPNSVMGLEQRHKLFPYTTLTGLSNSIHRTVIDSSRT